MILPICPLLAERHKKLSRRAKHRIDAPEVRLVERVLVLPPKTLHGPWCFTNLVAPGRGRVWVDLARNRVGRMRKIGAWQPELHAGIPLRHRHQVLDQTRVRLVLLDVIAGEDAPPHLLRVVVHVVVTVPRSPDAAAGPVTEQSRRHLAGLEATREEVLVAIPKRFHFLVAELHR